MKSVHWLNKALKPYSGKGMTITFIGMLILGLMLDFGVNITGISHITVDGNFVSDIYSAIVTISVLNFSLIALISGFLDSRFFGYELREILNFSNSPVKMKRFIVLSLGNVLLATVALELNYIISSVNTLLLLLIETILLIAYTGIKICQLMVSKDICIELVKQYYSFLDVQKSLSYDFFCKNLNKLVQAWIDTLKEHDAVNKDIVWNMIGNLCEPISKAEKQQYYQFYKYFDSRIKTNIMTHSLIFGFRSMIEDVIKIYDKIGASDYDKRDIYAIPLDIIKFYDDKMLLSLNILTEIMDIPFSDLYKKDKITSTDMEWIYYRYFNALADNLSCTEATKKELVQKYIHELSKANYFSTETDTKLINEEQSALLNIFRYKVFQNSDQKERKFIYESLLFENLSNNRFNERSDYFNYLSIITQMAYAYIVLERETLTKQYREDLKSLIITDIHMPTIAILNLGIVVRMNIRGILKALATRLEAKNNFTKKYEYFSMPLVAKSAIWTEEFDISFFFMLYLLYNKEIGYLSPFAFFDNWETLENNRKKIIMYEIKKSFDNPKKTLSYDAVKALEPLAALFKTDINISEDAQRKLFDYLNEHACGIIIELADEPVNLSTNKENVYAELMKIMDREKVYGWDAAYNNKFPILIRVPDLICRKKNRDDRSTAYDLKNAVTEAIHKYIRRTSKLELSFNEEGLQVMADFLGKTTFDSRNYTFTDDLCWNKENRESDIFNRIISLNKDINLIQTNAIREYFYYSRDNFKYNINIIDCQLHELEAKEGEELIEGSKTYNGLYNIDGALFPKTEALELLQKIFCRQSLVFELMISFMPDEIAHIEFKR